MYLRTNSYYCIFLCRNNWLVFRRIRKIAKSKY